MSPSLTRRSMVAGGVIEAAGLLNTRASEASTSAMGHGLAQHAESNLTLEIYKGFALNQLDRWDAVIHPDVKANSPAGRDIVGLQTLKRFNQAFITAFQPRTDLIDHFVSGDRGLVTVNLHWTHSGGPFNGIAPTGQSGTSVESFLLRINNGLLTHWDVADNSLDLATYLRDQGMKLPRLVVRPRS